MRSPPTTLSRPSADSSDLSEAVDATLESASFVMTATDAQGTTSTITYQAPDRARLVSDTTEVIVIGEDFYLSQSAPTFPADPEQLEPEPTGRFSQQAAPRGYIGSSVMAPLRLLREVEVTAAEDGAFQFDFEGGSGDAIVRDGMVVRFTLPFELQGETTSVTYELTDLDSAPAIEAPDPSLVDVAPPTPDCGEDGLDDRQILCADTLPN